MASDLPVVNLPVLAGRKTIFHAGEPALVQSGLTELAAEALDEGLRYRPCS